MLNLLQKEVDELKVLIEELWNNIENGTVGDNFFELREKVRNVLLDL